MGKLKGISVSFGYRFNGRLVFYWAIMALFAFISCKNKDKKQEKTVFKLNIDQGVTSLDPAFARSQNNIWCVNMLYNGLLQLNNNLKAVPAIAKSFSISDDGKSYTFILRNDVYFHDSEVFENGKGRKLTASDFVYSFSRLINPETAASGAWIFNDKVSGPEAFVALDDTSFRINLNKPFPPLPGLLCSPYAFVLAHEAVEKHGKDYRSHPVGTGPFRFEHWKEGEVLVFLKNEHYFEKDRSGTALPYLDAVKIHFIGDIQTAFMEFLNGNLDFFNSVDGSYRNEILTKSGKVKEAYKKRFQLVRSPFLNTEYLGFLMDTTVDEFRNSPVHNKKIRKAINYAINKQQMVKYLRNSVGKPGTAGFVPKGLPAFNEEKVKGYAYNPAKARELLREAGFPGGKGLAPITLHTSTTYKDLIEYVQGELKNIGIPVKVEVHPGAALRSLAAKNGAAFFRASWIADYPDAENYLSVFYSRNKVPNGPNYTMFDNADFDRFYEKASRETNDSIRLELYHKMDNLVMEEAPVVVLYYDELVNMYQNNISGFNTNAQNMLELKRIRKSSEQ